MREDVTQTLSPTQVTAVPQPNHRLRAARERTPSRRIPGTYMTREEVAEEVSLWIAQHDDKGREIAFDAGHLGKLERGTVRRPRDHYVAALCAVLGANEAELGFVPERRSSLISSSVAWDRDAVTDAVETITRTDLAATRRQALAAVCLAGAALTQPLQRWLDPLSTVSPPTIGASFSPPEVEALETLVDQLHELARHSGGALARKAIVAQLSELGDRLHQAPSGPMTTRVMLATAQLAETAASMSWDAGVHRAAQRYYVLSVQLAKVAGEDALAAVALAGLGRQCFDLKRPNDGLEVVQLAQYGTRHSATPRMRAMLATREAWGYAQLGEIQAFQRAIGLAQDHYAEADDTEPCKWVRSFDLAELHGVIGARFRDLAHHAPSHARHAQAHIGRALELRDPHRLRNRAFDLIGLARADLVASEPEQAASLIHQAAPLATRWPRGRVRVKLAEFYRESARFAEIPAIRDARDEIRDLTS